MDRPAPETYQPPLTWWGQAWRVLLTLVISAVVWVATAEAQVEQAPLLFYVDVLVGVAAYVLMFFRRRWPLTIALVTNVMGAISGVAQGPATLTSVSLATRRRLLHVLVVALVALAAVGALARDPLVLAVLLAPGYYGGMVAGTRLFARFDDRGFRCFTLVFLAAVSAAILLA